MNSTTPQFQFSYCRNISEVKAYFNCILRIPLKSAFPKRPFGKSFPPGVIHEHQFQELLPSQAQQLYCSQSRCWAQCWCFQRKPQQSLVPRVLDNPTIPVQENLTNANHRHASTNICNMPGHRKLLASKLASKTRNPPF